MQPIVAAAILAIQVHFAASYLVPLKTADMANLPWFLAPLPWVWPWHETDAGLLGRVAPELSTTGFFIAMTAAALSLLAAFAVMGWLVPHDWWRPLAIAGSVVSLALMAGFFAPDKILPVALDLAVAYAIFTSWSPLGAIESAAR